jgi:hypothetical protein
VGARWARRCREGNAGPAGGRSAEPRASCARRSSHTEERRHRDGLVRHVVAFGPNDLQSAQTVGESLAAARSRGRPLGSRQLVGEVCPGGRGVPWKCSI